MQDKHGALIMMLPVMLAESQLQAFSVARRLVMFSDVVRTCRETASSKHGNNLHFQTWFVT